ncbi:MAG: glycosyltransferase, partial [Oscillospiraceae bacterium]
MRRLLQELILPENDRGCPEMFFRGGRKADGGIILRDGETLSFDTYFNSFAYTKYRDLTTVKQVEFAVRVLGAAELRLCVFTGGSSICVAQTGGNGVLALSVKLSSLPAAGFLYAEIKALGEAGVLGGGFSAECEPRETSVAVAICTFRREEFVLRNIEVLRAAKFSFIKRVFVVDNGGTLDGQALSDDFVRVIPNKNYGGSGGFSRGMLEACDGGFSHVLLMDDDIEFYPEVLERMTVFLSLLDEPHRDSCFSAAMLFLSEDNPYIQWEMGGGWSGRFVESKKHNVDVRDKRVLLDNLDNDEV